MGQKLSISQLLTVATLLVVIGTAYRLIAAGNTSSTLRFLNPNGILENYSESRPIDVSGAFFQNLGTNGRTCGSCHQPSDAFSITPANLRQRFNATNGTDPVF